jgi:predicted MFS family arabinose efflux permease
MPAAPVIDEPETKPVDELRGFWSAIKNRMKETTFRSFRHRNYRLYFAGQMVSFIGSWMQSAALMWLLYDRTGDPRWPSWLMVATVGPTLLLGTWGGGLADRFPKRRLIFLTQSCFLVHALVLTCLIGFDLLPPWLVLALMAVSGIIQAVDLPTRLSFVPDLVPKEDLINAIGLNSLLFNSARAIGPAFAALLFLLAAQVLPLFPPGASAVTIGAVTCFGLNAASFVAVLIALNGIRVPGEALGASRPRAASFWDGFRYLRERSAMGGLVLVTLLMCIFGWPLLTILPAYTRLNLGLNEQTYSLLVSAVGGGALIGALTTATFGKPSRRGQFLVLGAGVATIGLFAASAASRPEFAAMACAAVGFGLILFLSTGQSTLQLAVPDEKRGRVMALWAMTISASAPLGHLLAGQAVTMVGVQPVLMGMAVGTAGCAVFLAAALALSLRIRLWPVRFQLDQWVRR